MKFKIHSVTAALVLCGLLSACALAANQTYQDANILDTWNTTDANWDAGIVWTNGNTAIFGGTGETVTVGTVSAAGITLNSSGYTLSGGAITSTGTITANESAGINSNIVLGAGQAWSVVSGKTLALGGVISGSSTLTYGGAGSYSLGGINTNSGNLTIDTAKVTVGLGATLYGSGLGWAKHTVTVQNGGILVANNYSNGAGNLWGQIGDDTNNIILQSGGVFQMTGATMDSTVNKGITITAGETGYFRVATGTSTVWDGTYTSRDFLTNAGSTLVFDGGGNFETSRYIRGAGNVTKNDGGTLKLKETNGFSGTLTVNGGILEAAKTTTGGAASAIGGGSSTISVNSGGTLLISGNRGTGYHSGAATINGGTITMNGDDLSFVTANTLTFDSAAGTIDGTGMWRRRDGGNKVAVTAAASGSTISVATLNLLDSAPVFEVADGAAAADLTISSAITGGSSLNKTGAGALVISGVSNSYSGGTNVNEGTLVVDGALGNTAVTIASGAALEGTGTLAGSAAIDAGGSISPAGASTIGTLTVNGVLSLVGDTLMDVNKSGASLTSDVITGTGSVGLGGTLKLTASGDSLALGDSFVLITSSGGLAGSFANYDLPTLPSGLSWDISSLAADGSITVSNFAVAPAFNPPSGNYVGAQSVSITSESGATIYYTTDGSPPTTSSSSGLSPVSGIIVPVDSTVTLRAFATKSGVADSVETTASYTTIATGVWNVDSDGSWSDDANWLSNAVPDGSGVAVDFTLPQTGPATATLDTNRTVGSMTFGNSNNFDWQLASSGGSILTLASGTGTPTITVLDNTTLISAAMTGTQGLIKNGPGSLALTAANIWSGATTVSEGNLQLGNTGAIPDGSTIDITGGSITGTRAGGTFHFLARSTASALNMSSGSLDISNTAQYWDITLGNTAVATYNQTGGNATFNAGEVDVANNPGSGGTSISLSGGSFVVAGAVGTPNKKLILAIRGDASFNVSGTADVAIPDFVFGHASGVASTGTLNLDGGTLLTEHLSLANGTAILNLNGGLLKSSADNATFLAGLTTANMRDGGAFIDTNGHDISVAQDLLHSALPGDNASDGGLTKSGSGTLTLTGAATYTGPTSVNNGSLVVDGSLAATSAVTVASGASLGGSGTVAGTVAVSGTIAPGASVGTLSTGALAITGIYACEIDAATADALAVTGDLNLSGSTLTVTEINPASAAGYVIATYTGTRSGTFASVSSGYDVTYDDLSKEVVLTVISNGFAAWADSWTGPVLSDKTPAGDPDLDGISNLMEYVLGGDPRVSSSSILPTRTLDAVNLVFEFTRSDDSETDTVQTVEWSADMVNWTSIAIPVGTLGDVTVTENGAAVDDISVVIPRSNAPGGKLFARLMVVQP